MVSRPVTEGSVVRAYGTRAERAGEQSNPRRVSTPGTPAAPMLTLQRLAGNAAVSRAVEKERHEHGPGCDHAEQAPAGEQARVQRRVSVAEALASPGSRPDPHVLSRAEQAYGMSLDHVRVHTGPVAQRSAAEFNAIAYTSGSDIVSGLPHLDDETMYHELDHVRQQAMGPVAGTDNGTGTKVSSEHDPFEQQAADNGRRLSQGAAPDLSLPGRPAPVQRSTSGRPGGPVQRMDGGSAAGSRSRRPQRQRVRDLPLFISGPRYALSSTRGAGGARSRAILGPNSLFGMGSDANARLPHAIDAARDRHNYPFIAGHLLNADFGGTGRDSCNLTILTPTANSAMKNFDNPVKAAVTQLRQVYEYLADLYLPIDRLDYGIEVEISVSGPEYVWGRSHPDNCISQFIRCGAWLRGRSRVDDFYDERDRHNRQTEAVWREVRVLMGSIRAYVARANDADLIDNAR